MFRADAHVGRSISMESGRTLRLRQLVQSEGFLGYLLVAPLALVLGLIAYPLVYAVYLSLTDKTVGFPGSYVGLRNFVELLNDEIFVSTVSNSIIYALVTLVFKLILGLGMALTLNEAVKGRDIFRATLLIPWITPTIVTCMAWLWMYDDMVGVLNAVLMKAGLISFPIPWLAQANSALTAVIISNVWRGFPYFGIMLLAALQGIPKDLYEAASVDGANVVQRFWNITIPGLRNVIMVVSIMSIIWALNDFEMVWLITRGQPFDRTHIFGTLTYKYAFETMQLGKGIAVSVFMAPLLVILILFVNRALRRGEAE